MFLVEEPLLGIEWNSSLLGDIVGVLVGLTSLLMTTYDRHFFFSIGKLISQ